MTAFRRLFEPLQVGPLTLPNRVVMGSMHLGLEEVEGGFEAMAEFYAERARGGVGLIVTGGVSPNHAGRPFEVGATLSTANDVGRHQLVTRSVHDAGSRIILQLLHFGRYAKHPDLVAPSSVRAPINRFVPREMDPVEIEETIDDFAAAAVLAQTAGYDGVEIMGSEGYLINEFLAPRTNLRLDEWGGDFDNRARFALEIVRRTRRSVGEDFLISFRISVTDLVPDGSTFTETIELARRLEQAGVSILSTGVGWHESSIPTIASPVPAGAFRDYSAKIRAAVTVPVVASNRINTPELAEAILASGSADLVSMARPLLADPDFVNKARTGRAHRINTCIACNQACIDHTLAEKTTTCLVNPRAGHELTLLVAPPKVGKRVGVVGAGPAGMAFSAFAARRGHQVTLFESRPTLGGQFDLAWRIPGKSEYRETIRYYEGELDEAGVSVRLKTQADAELLVSENFDEIVLATGVKPREISIAGASHPSVVSYVEVLRGRAPIGDRVAIIGAGGIGFDIAAFVTNEESSDTHAREDFFRHWGVDVDPDVPGGVRAPVKRGSARRVYLLQRKTDKVGAGLGLTTGWIHRAHVTSRGVEMMSGVTYEAVDDAGLHITVNGRATTLDVDTVIVCAGQLPERDIYDELLTRGIPTHLIGGASVAAELDAKRAIREGAELAASI
ncbi:MULTISPECIES: NADPH-dependent 2,4-dienoyl-CoA reductase [Rhodococcus]|uniref:NADPH-dependent 2,4-dienoyl-CoA reductase n=1 Tax=Rhodococcus TaxID=1827 RepID=UPI002953E014|nr:MULTISPECIES: NADPH-dependent 2,4-dienoyl-CoA reductase [Rhodococcus]MDV7246813.1 NADPH-dependent 2,4-dienoyl-CoA reductase [Rhodococcus oxybenzonivorans]MDV7278414.1 NADPH-dependent 2,4-dienoyl-CoA reductase [Rhodococcus oxybenzonivorans]MDV7348132.1 NADPH-dependent 2,4-dienoyl-CoA reductase [Rhodococcus oxybenzonivorans]MDV8031766.1 NADPH-dependent 2,4-dienoyl-CoA reductase [Rhodococcus sp. IEGM 27]MDV8107401.1 NADPH-dependent 2,4-dienoyl-CoA reductase [Rhodococcus sp. IEGM 69]